MDATRQFPFADKTFHYVYTEHMIEHVPTTKACTCCRNVIGP